LKRPQPRGFIGSYNYTVDMHTCYICKKRFTTVRAVNGHMNAHTKHRDSLLETEHKKYLYSWIEEMFQTAVDRDRDYK
jgi:hypothetical protein